MRLSSLLSPQILLPPLSEKQPKSNIKNSEEKITNE